VRGGVTRLQSLVRVGATGAASRTREQVSLVYPRIIDLVSPKVGGFYYSPIFGWQYENFWLNR
jgi:hypothetical protein